MNDYLLVKVLFRNGIVRDGELGVGITDMKLDVYGIYSGAARVRLRLRQIEGGLPNARLNAAEKAPADS